MILTVWSPMENLGSKGVPMMKKSVVLVLIAFVTFSVQNAYSANEKDVKRAKAGDKNLEKADLSGASLVGAKLSRANLTQANLTGGTFTKADFSNAVLNGAQLNRADVSKANFTGANLIGVNFTDAIVTNCDMNRAKVGDFWKDFLSKQKIKNFKKIIWSGY
jgi:uncharacterized protein YjbI with pentapeptide repeats